MTDIPPSSLIQPDEDALSALREEESRHEADLRAIHPTDQEGFRAECDRHMDRLVQIFRELIDRRK